MMNNPLIYKLPAGAQKPPPVGRFSSTHGIVHAGFRGLRAFVARKKVGVN